MTPARPLIYSLTVLSFAGIALFWLPQFETIWAATIGILLLVAALDYVALSRSVTPRATRTLAHTVALGVERTITLEVENRTGRPLQADIFDHVPMAFSVDNLPQRLIIEPHEFARIEYRVRPTERGRHSFGPIELRLYSRLTFWSRRVLHTADDAVKVFPNFAEVSKYAVLGVDSQASAGGIHTRPMRGEGSEFHQLREYRVGDTFRQIDWKATARIGKLIAKEYQEERDQQIVFMIDTGRRMLAREHDLSHFDYVLNAMLLLSYVALRQGDAVGFLTCGDQPLWMKPRKGLSAINTLTNRLFDLQPEPVAIDYQAAATQLALRQKRRALVVLLTNIRDEDSDDLRSAFRLLRRKHLLLVASLREPGIDTLLANSVADFDSALQFASAHHYLDSRRATHESIGGKGVIIEDTSCEQLPLAIANRYMEIKRARML